MVGIPATPSIPSITGGPAVSSAATGGYVTFGNVYSNGGSSPLTWLAIAAVSFYVWKKWKSK